MNSVSLPSAPVAAGRRSALGHYDVLDDAQRAELQELALLTARAFGMPAAAIGFVGDGTLRPQAAVGVEGLEARLTPAHPCAWTLEADGVTVVPDLDADPRFADRPGSLRGFRFYAGAPLETPGGHRVGALWVMDGPPREALSGAQSVMLPALARQVIDRLELRLALRRACEATAGAHAARGRLEAILESSTAFAIITSDREGLVTGWNSGAERILGWSEAEVLGRHAELFFTPEDCASGRPEEEGLRAVRDGSARDERWHVRRDGGRFWASGTVTPLRDAAGGVTGFLKILRDRTEQHAAGQALEASESFNRSVLDSSPDCIKVLDLEGRLRFISNPGLAALEIDRFEDVAGRHWADGWPEAGRAEVLAALDAARQGGTARFQGYCPTMKGRPRWWDVAVSPVAGPDGMPARILAVSRDVTARREREEELRRVNQRFQLALDAGSVIGTWNCDVPEDRMIADAGLARAFGLDPERAAIGLPVRDFAAGIHPGDRRRFGAAVLRALRRGGPFRADCRLPGPDGVPRWVEASGFCEHDGNGRALRFPGLLLEIDSRKRAEAALQRLTETLEQRVRDRTDDLHRERERLREVLANLPIGVAVYAAPDGELLFHNDRVAAQLGLGALPAGPPEQFDRLYGAVHADGTPYAAGEYPVVRVLRNGRAVGPEDMAYRRPDGSGATLSVRAAPIRGGDGGMAYVLVAVDDVSTRRQIEESLRQAQKMEAVGQLTGGLAHDFNNLLAGIVGSLELIRARIAQGRAGEVDKYLGAAATSANRAAALTHRLLAFSRRQTLDPKPVDVNRLCSGMEDLIRRTVGPEIAVETAMPGGLWTVLCDPHQLENALLNLSINARDAMPGGGQLVVEAANIRFDSAAAAREKDIAPGQYVAVAVSDTGTGMDRATAARVFEPFFTTKPTGQGTGLGLSMVYGFARQSGGQVRLHTMPGAGTTVRIYLPRHLGEGAVEPEAEAPGEAPRSRTGESVLVVDDEPVVRMLVADVLAELGYAAIEAGDGAEGLRILESGRAVDLLVTDVGLPGGMNGRQLADAARARRPGLKVLFITGYAESAAIGSGVLEPGMQVLGKPFAMDDLAARIRDMLAS